MQLAAWQTRGRAGELVQLLLRQGADATKATTGGTTALHHACQNGDTHGSLRVKRQCCAYVVTALPVYCGCEEEVGGRHQGSHAICLSEKRLAALPCVYILWKTQRGVGSESSSL